MNGAFRTTALMGILAVAMIAGAIYYYPRSAEIVVDAKVNQNLFETYETNDIRSIAIMQFSDDSNRMEQFRLRRKGERWVIPNVGDFPVTRIGLIGEVAKSLLDRKVLSLATEDEQGHVEYGVVDPTEGGNSNRSSLGMRIDLRDRNKADIANLIVGKAVPGNSDGVPRYYVRIPGQPAVYELEIPKQIFRTRFQDWVDPNLMELPTPGMSEVSISEINVDQYRLDPKKIAGADRESTYRCSIKPKNFLFESYDGGEFKEKQLDQAQQREVASKLSSIGNIRYVDVLGKPKATAKLLRKPSSIADSEVFEPLGQFGFRLKDSEFEGANGEVSVATSDGVRVRLLLGSLAQRADSTESLDLHFHGILVAEMEDSTFEAPTKPEGVEEDSAENKAYLRAMEELDRKQKSAKIRIDELNRNWSKWIYVIPESTVNAIRPDVTL